MITKTKTYELKEFLRSKDIKVEGDNIIYMGSDRNYISIKNDIPYITTFDIRVATELEKLFQENSLEVNIILS